MRVVAILIVALLLAGCDGFVGEISRPKDKGPEIPAVEPDYVVLRPVTATPAAGAISAVLYGQTLYFQPSERILDLKHLDPRLFLDGRLISAPIVQTALDDMILLQGGFTKPEAEAILARLRRGGSAL